MRRWLLAACLALLAAAPALAHKPSDSYLSLSVDAEGIRGQWDIALRDLDFAIGLDADGNGEITWGELRRRHADIAALALSRLALRSDGGECSVTVGAQLLDDHTDGAYSVLPLQVDCPQPPAALTIDYRLFADLDPQHRGLLRLSVGDQTRTAVLGPQANPQTFTLQAASRLAQFVAYAREGVWHIWIGFDHILFLLSLLLPAVLVWRAARWQAAESFGAAFWDVFRIVTSFTIAHSITLDAGHAGLGDAAVACGRVGDRGLGRPGGAEQRLAAGRRPGAGRWPSASA